MHASTASLIHLHLRPWGGRDDEPVRYALGQSSLGRFVVGRRQAGICCIVWGEDEAALQAQLAAAFPGAARHEDGRGLAGELAQVTALIDRGQVDAPMDFDVAGTPFQQQVWQSLCRIPAGQTRSYKQVAQALGQPDAARAVAGACAANVLALAIPCHRVLRSDGTVSGYRWGVDRKRALLARERQA
jgi:O-6-methylguanine DNA methyltransferase